MKYIFQRGAASNPFFLKDALVDVMHQNLWEAYN